MDYEVIAHYSSFYPKFKVDFNYIIKIKGNPSNLLVLHEKETDIITSPNSTLEIGEITKIRAAIAVYWLNRGKDDI